MSAYLQIPKMQVNTRHYGCNSSTGDRTQTQAISGACHPASLVKMGSSRFSKPKVEGDGGRLLASASGCHMDTHAHVSTHKHVHTNTSGKEKSTMMTPDIYGNYHDSSTHANKMGGTLVTLSLVKQPSGGSREVTFGS